MGPYCKVLPFYFMSALITGNKFLVNNNNTRYYCSKSVENVDFGGNCGYKKHIHVVF